jgi:hypothetical protein
MLKEATLEYLKNSRHGDVRLNPAVAAVAETIARKYETSNGKRDGWENPALPWGKILETAAAAPQALQEANPSTAQTQLLRAGVQLVANAWYKRYPATYTKVAMEAASDKRQEFYAPLFGASRPQEVKAGTPFREQGIKGVDREIINRKFGAIEAFERELFDDDQTGQIATRAQRLGESMSMWEDQYFSRRFLGAASTDFAPTAIAASSWTGENAVGTAITTPFSTDLYTTPQDLAPVGNRLATYAQLSFPGLLTAFQGLRRAKDPLGQAMVVIPDTLLVSTFDEINGRMLTQSPAFPATQGRGGETVSNAVSGFFRGPFGMNPVQGEFALVVNIHLKSGAWAVGQGGRGYIMQRRDPMEIVQELPQSGDSFTTDAYRFRSRSRWEQDWIDPRFWFLGNDGSASLTQ